jgi:hypothetical protein
MTVTDSTSRVGGWGAIRGICTAMRRARSDNTRDQEHTGAVAPDQNGSGRGTTSESESDAGSGGEGGGDRKRKRHGKAVVSTERSPKRARAMTFASLHGIGGSGEDRVYVGGSQDPFVLAVPGWFGRGPKSIGTLEDRKIQSWLEAHPRLSRTLPAGIEEFPAELTLVNRDHIALMLSASGPGNWGRPCVNAKRCIFLQFCVSLGVAAVAPAVEFLSPEEYLQDQRRFYRDAREMGIVAHHGAPADRPPRSCYLCQTLFYNLQYAEATASVGGAPGADTASSSSVGRGAAAATCDRGPDGTTGTWCNPFRVPVEQEGGYKSAAVLGGVGGAGSGGILGGFRVINLADYTHVRRHSEVVLRAMDHAGTHPDVISSLPQVSVLVERESLLFRVRGATSVIPSRPVELDPVILHHQAAAAAAPPPPPPPAAPAPLAAPTRQIGSVPDDTPSLPCNQIVASALATQYRGIFSDLLGIKVGGSVTCTVRRPDLVARGVPVVAGKPWPECLAEQSAAPPRTPLKHYTLLALGDPTAPSTGVDTEFATRYRMSDAGIIGSCFSNPVVLPSDVGECRARERLLAWAEGEMSLGRPLATPQRPGGGWSMFPVLPTDNDGAARTGGDPQPVAECALAFALLEAIHAMEALEGGGAAGAAGGDQWFAAATRLAPSVARASFDDWAARVTDGDLCWIKPWTHQDAVRAPWMHTLAGTTWLYDPHCHEAAGLGRGRPDDVPGFDPADPADIRSPAAPSFAIAKQFAASFLFMVYLLRETDAPRAAAALAMRNAVDARGACVSFLHDRWQQSMRIDDDACRANTPLWARLYSRGGAAIISASDVDSIDDADAIVAGFVATRRGVTDGDGDVCADGPTNHERHSLREVFAEDPEACVRTRRSASERITDALKGHLSEIQVALLGDFSAACRFISGLAPGVAVEALKRMVASDGFRPTVPDGRGGRADLVTLLSSEDMFCGCPGDGARKVSPRGRCCKTAIIAVTCLMRINLADSLVELAATADSLAVAEGVSSTSVPVANDICQLRPGLIPRARPSAMTPDAAANHEHAKKLRANTRRRVQRAARSAQRRAARSAAADPAAISRATAAPIPRFVPGLPPAIAAMAAATGRDGDRDHDRDRSPSPAMSEGTTASEEICRRICPDNAALASLGARLRLLAIEFRNTHLDYILALISNPWLLSDLEASRPCGPLELFYPHDLAVMTAGNLPDHVEAYVRAGVMRSVVRPTASTAPPVLRAVPAAFSNRLCPAVSVPACPPAMLTAAAAAAGSGTGPTANMKRRLTGVAAAVVAAEGRSSDLANALAAISPAFHYLERTALEASLQGLYPGSRVAPTAAVAIATHGFFMWQPYNHDHVQDLVDRMGALFIYVLREHLLHYCTVSPVLADALDTHVACGGGITAYATTITDIMDTVRAARNVGIPISTLTTWIRAIHAKQTPHTVPAPSVPPVHPTVTLLHACAMYDKQRLVAGSFLWGDPEARLPRVPPAPALSPTATAAAAAAAAAATVSVSTGDTLPLEDAKKARKKKKRATGARVGQEVDREDEGAETTASSRRKVLKGRDFGDAPAWAQGTFVRVTGEDLAALNVSSDASIEAARTALETHIRTYQGSTLDASIARAIAVGPSPRQLVEREVLKCATWCVECAIAEGKCAPEAGARGDLTQDFIARIMHEKDFPIIITTANAGDASLPASSFLARLLGGLDYREAVLRLAITRAPRPDGVLVGTAVVQLWGATDGELECVRRFVRCAPRGMVPSARALAPLGLTGGPIGAGTEAYDAAVLVASPAGAGAGAGAGASGAVGGTQREVAIIEQLARMSPHDYAIARATWVAVAASMSGATGAVTSRPMEGFANDIVHRQIRAVAELISDGGTSYTPSSMAMLARTAVRADRTRSAVASSFIECASLRHEAIARGILRLDGDVISMLDNATQAVHERQASARALADAANEAWRRRHAAGEWRDNPYTAAWDGKAAERDYWGLATERLSADLRLREGVGDTVGEQPARRQLARLVTALVKSLRAVATAPTAYIDLVQQQLDTMCSRVHASQGPFLRALVRYCTCTWGLTGLTATSAGRSAPPEHYPFMPAHVAAGGGEEYTGARASWRATRFPSRTTKENPYECLAAVGDSIDTAEDFLKKNEMISTITPRRSIVAQVEASGLELMTLTGNCCNKLSTIAIGPMNRNRSYGSFNIAESITDPTDLRCFRKADRTRGASQEQKHGVAFRKHYPGAPAPDVVCHRSCAAEHSPPQCRHHGVTRILAMGRLVRPACPDYKNARPTNGSPLVIMPCCGRLGEDHPQCWSAAWWEPLVCRACKISRDRYDVVRAAAIMACPVCTTTSSQALSSEHSAVIEFVYGPGSASVARATVCGSCVSSIRASGCFPPAMFSGGARALAQFTFQLSTLQNAVGVGMTCQREVRRTRNNAPASFSSIMHRLRMSSIVA